MRVNWAEGDGDILADRLSVEWEKLVERVKALACVADSSLCYCRRCAIAQLETLDRRP